MLAIRFALVRPAGDGGAPPAAAGLRLGPARSSRRAAELALRAGSDDEVGVAFEPPPFDRDDVDVEFIGHPLSRLLSVLCGGLWLRLLRLLGLRWRRLRLLGLRLFALRLVGLRLFALRRLGLWLLALRLAILRLLGFLLRLFPPAAFTFRRLHGLVDRPDHVEGLFGEIVVLAVEDFTETADRLLQGHVFPGTVGEHLGDEERLREEPFDLAGAGYQQLVILRQLVHPEDGDDVLQF